MLTTTVRTGPRLTLAMRQAIEILSLPAPALLARIAVVAAENKALRVVPPRGLAQSHTLLDPEGLAAPGNSLIAHVLQQIDTMTLPPRARAIAFILADALEPTGWLGRDLASLARDCAVPLPEMEAVLQRLQKMEPEGLFARSLAECLRLQAQATQQMTPEVEAVLARLPMLAKGDLAGIALDASIDLADINHAVGVIRGLNPKPGLAFESPIPTPQPPDLLATKRADGWIAVPHPSRFRVEVMSNANTNAKDHSDAMGWQRAIARRTESGADIATLLLRHQTAHLDGLGPLQPISAAEIAEACGLHIATVNRILRGLFCESPLGTWPLRHLQARALRKGGVAISTVRQELEKLLTSAGSRDLSDTELARILGTKGMAVARRTVAKYRAEITGKPRRAGRKPAG